MPATPSKFALAMKKRAAVWKKASKAQARQGGMYGPADVPDGQYEAVCSAKSGFMERGDLAGTPYFEITTTISEGECQGKEPRGFYILDGKMPSDDPDAMPTNEEKLVGDLKILLSDVDVEEVIANTPELIESLATEITNRSPKVKIGVRNRIGKKGTKGEGKRFQDVYFNALIDGGSSNGQAQVETSEVEVEEEAQSLDGEEGGEPVEEEGGEPVAPVKGDVVTWKPRGAQRAREFKVKTVNNGKETVTLLDEKAKKQFSDVPWSDIDIVS